MKPEEYIKLKTAVDLKQREVDRAAGALEETVKQIKAEFGCKSFDEAKKKLAELEAEEARCEAEFNKALKKFNDEWQHCINGTTAEEG